MVVADAGFKAGAAVITAAFGGLILAGDHKRAPNQFLAVFLLLIAGNQFIETVRALGGWGLSTHDLGQLASAFAFLDPLALFYFISVFPERNQLNQAPVVASVAVLPLLLTATTPFLDPLPTEDPFSVGVFAVWAAMTAGIYSLALGFTVSQAGRTDHQRTYAALIPALCIAVIPAWARVLKISVSRVLVHGFGIASPLTSILRSGSAIGLPLIVTLLLAAYAWRYLERGNPARNATLLGAVGAFLVTLAANPGNITRAGTAMGIWSVAQTPAWAPSASMGGALKWLLFSAFASAALLREDLLNMGFAMRRRAARVLVGLSAAGVAFGAAISIATVAFEEALVPAIGVAALFLVVWTSTHGFRVLVDRTAERVYGVPRPGAKEELITAYRAGVEQAVEDGRALGADPGLERLRDELGIDDATAAAIERLAGQPDEAPLEPGHVVDGRYQIKQMLGRGASGRTFLARDELLHRDVAVKEVLHDHASDKARVLQEARAATQVNHPNVVTVHDVITRPGATLIVSEYVPGGTLREHLSEQGPTKPKAALAILDGLLSGLEAIHGQGLAHGDLKPANILLPSGQRPRIGDFGAARTAGGGTARLEDEILEGTPAYMAPERRRGAPPSVAADLFSVGAILDEMVPMACDGPLGPLLDRSLATEPEDRFASATEMRESLREIRSQPFNRGT